MGSKFHRHAADADRLSDAEVLILAHELSQTFLEVLREYMPGNDLLDVETLPASKASIENAFRLVIATEASPQVRRRMAKAGMVLANFQPGIGRRVSLVPVSTSASGSAHDDERARLVQARLDRAFAGVEDDVMRLRKVFNQSEELARRRFEPMTAAPPFQEDGTYTWHGHH